MLIGKLQNILRCLCILSQTEVKDTENYICRSSEVDVITHPSIAQHGTTKQQVPASGQQDSPIQKQVSTDKMAGGGPVIGQDY